MSTELRAELLAASPAELDARFAAALPGRTPTGGTRGTALLAPGTRFARPLAAWASTGWRGKRFDPTGTRLRNRLTPFGVPAITASVREEASWLDGRPCIVLDYSATSWVARFVRDEIREVAPGAYLGMVFAGRRRLPVRFLLEVA